MQVLADAQSLIEEISTQTVKNVILPCTATHVVIVSHDCEFNDNKRNKLLVARLQKVQGNLDAEQIASLRASNDVDHRTRVEEQPIDGVDNWLFDPIPGVFSTTMVASFTTITALPMPMRDDLKKAKKSELTHEHRVRFRRKLAWFMGRDADDISDDEKVEAPDVTSLAE
jgi:hypothetical protein